ncbi:hypothetical protein BN2475_450133 [Paraburkholderia ribeironis]|uniref:Uncharacterized protein n=1 Tax=Paraburkholderia ribeironis TaxID=1247936 RepID=A0A1N7S934_9BURK|nr:hypothetical protein BN2475_450133 [Paraburkholderia ribeironis]
MLNSVYMFNISGINAIQCVMIHLFSISNRLNISFRYGYLITLTIDMPHRRYQLDHADRQTSQQFRPRDCSMKRLAFRMIRCLVRMSKCRAKPEI